ncbi:hypothetical protein MPER_15746, partial [Moniliophthora perniciosa FA553]
NFLIIDVSCKSRNSVLGHGTTPLLTAFYAFMYQRLSKAGRCDANV